MTNGTSPSDFYSKEAIKYEQDRFSSKAGAFWSRVNLHNVLNLINLEKIKNKVVVDIGCGTGRFTIPLAHHAQRVYALDIAPSMLSVVRNKAKERGISDKIEIMTSDAEEINLDDESIDFVISINVMSHLEHPNDVFSEVRRILKPGGIFLFNYPNLNSFFFPIGYYVNHKSRAVFKNVFTHWYSSSEISTLLKSVGFETLVTNGLVLPTNLPSYFLQRIPLFYSVFQNSLLTKLCSNVYILTQKI